MKKKLTKIAVNTLILVANAALSYYAAIVLFVKVLDFSRPLASAVLTSAIVLAIVAFFQLLFLTFTLVKFIFLTLARLPLINRVFRIHINIKTPDFYRRYYSKIHLD